MSMLEGPKLYWLDTPFDRRLAVSTRPGGWEELEESAAGWRGSGLDVIVSMLEREEAEDMGLADQSEICRAAGLHYINCPVPDHGTPEDEGAVLAAVDEALAHLKQGKRVAAHCFAGIGRSPLFVACVLVRYGVPVDVAWNRLIVARGLRLPDTSAQQRWVSTFARGFGPPPV
jgi:protein tyrosine phosphatase (PTP) superfamily phosphohydrolase (DUF442 family)